MTMHEFVVSTADGVYALNFENMPLHQWLAVKTGLKVKCYEFSKNDTIISDDGCCFVYEYDYGIPEKA